MRNGLIREPKQGRGLPTRLRLFHHGAIAPFQPNQSAANRPNAFDMVSLCRMTTTAGAANNLDRFIIIPYALFRLPLLARIRIVFNRKKPLLQRTFVETVV